MKRTGSRICIMILLMLSLAACATNKQEKPEAMPPPAPEVRMPEFILHRVLPGETMASIAKWYTGKDSTWRELAQHNPDLKPWNLKRGDLVKVPLQMATAHTNPPDHSTAPKKVKKSSQKSAPGKEIPPAAGPAGPAESEELFGPK